MNQLTLDVGELFINIYKEVTEYLSCVELKVVLPFEVEGDCISGRVETKPDAPYDLVLFCCMSQELAKQIVNDMSKGNVSSQEDIIIYIKEYINIASGRAVSTINNHIGKSARFCIPEVQNGKLDIGDIDRYESYASVFFRSEYGEMILKVAYTIDCCLKLADRV